MATLTALKFDTPTGAEEMLGRIQALQKQQLIQLQDAAIVTWPKGKKKPKTQQLASMTGTGALGGAFWGLLFGLLFFIPFLGMAIGAAMGAMAGHFSDYGIDDKFINEVKSKVTPGTSALFLLTSGAVQDRVVEALKGQKFEIISTNLSREQEDALVAAFAEESTDEATAEAATAEVATQEAPAEEATADEATAEAATPEATAEEAPADEATAEAVTPEATADEAPAEAVTPEATADEATAETATPEASQEPTKGA